MAEKHEVMPTTLKVHKEFRRDCEDWSASSWDKNILSLFHVDSLKTDNFADLRTFIDARYFEPTTDDEESRQSI